LLSLTERCRYPEMKGSGSASGTCVGREGRGSAEMSHPEPQPWRRRPETAGQPHGHQTGARRARPVIEFLLANMTPSMARRRRSHCPFSLQTFKLLVTSAFCRRMRNRELGMATSLGGLMTGRTVSAFQNASEYLMMERTPSLPGAFAASYSKEPMPAALASIAGPRVR